MTEREIIEQLSMFDSPYEYEYGGGHAPTFAPQIDEFGLSYDCSGFRSHLEILVGALFNLDPTNYAVRKAVADLLIAQAASQNTNEENT